ncbi:MAG TPA: hypothetical protein VFZ24_08760 [Longimicrobiales bacterium]
MNDAVNRAVPVMLAASLLLALAATSCAQPSNDSLVFRLEQALATSARTDFAQVVPGDWDRVCVFRPGTTYERVDSVLGTAWSGTRSTGIAARDDATLLVFARGGTVVEHVLYPIRKGDFGTPGPEQWYCRQRTRAVFELRQPIEGRIPWIGPVERR